MNGSAVDRNVGDAVVRGAWRHSRLEDVRTLLCVTIAYRRAREFGGWVCFRAAYKSCDVGLAYNLVEDA